MGRHRRSGAAPAADDHAAGAAGGHRAVDRRRSKRAAGLPVRGGLLGASAAMAVGAVAVASGLLPGGETFTLGGGSSERIRPDGSAELNAQGGSTAAPPPPSTPVSAAAPSTSPSPSPTPTKASASPSPTPVKTKTAEPKKASPTPTKAATTAPRTTAPAPPPPKTTAPAPVKTAVSRAEAAEAAVLDLVNKERAKAGCSPVRASGELGALARAYSQEMAERGFFSHTRTRTATPRGTARPRRASRAWAARTSPAPGRRRSRHGRLDEQRRPPGEHPELRLQYPGRRRPLRRRRALVDAELRLLRLPQVRAL